MNSPPAHHGSCKVGRKIGVPAENTENTEKYLGLGFTFRVFRVFRGEFLKLSQKSIRLVVTLQEPYADARALFLAGYNV